jgi:acetoin utilization deacetylase AcuC-like enzyme
MNEAARGEGEAGARTALVAHERYFWHDTSGSIAHSTASAWAQPARHYEHPDTKRRLLGLLEVSGLLEQLLRVAPRAATIDELRRFHTQAYIEQVRALSAGAGGEAGESAPVGHGSYEIALLAAGGCLAAGDAVMSGKARNAYALVRPPGHHAEADRGRGYCLFNNAVLLVRHLQRSHGLGRIAVVDWDVHHGNGTESAFIDDPSVLTISVHQERNYPLESGTLDVIGRGAAAGTNLNLPLPAGSGHGAYLASLERVVVPALQRFRPEFLVIASGFDASILDPLGRMMCTSETFRELTRLLMSAAAALCNARIVATHEGGYSNEYVPFCGLAVLEELSGVRTAAVDPYLAEFEYTAGRELLPHQDAAVNAAARLVAGVPGRG